MPRWCSLGLVPPDTVPLPNRDRRLRLGAVVVPPRVVVVVVLPSWMS